MGYSPRGRKESGTTERLNTVHTLRQVHSLGEVEKRVDFIHLNTVTSLKYKEQIAGGGVVGMGGMRQNG